MPRLFYTGIMLFMLPHFSRAQDPVIHHKIDSAVRQYNSQKVLEDKVRTGFFIADNYMELEKYDSAQFWLNLLSESYTRKEPSLFNYYLLTRQSEVFYYNGLLQLGLRTALQSKDLAMRLKDSLLIADAYNMTGLMYTTLDSCRKAKQYFHQGIPYSRQFRQSDNYLSLSKSHHFYGNLAEACEKLGEFDSAVIYSYVSLKKATETGSKRGMSVAHNKIGSVFLKVGLLDSSMHHFEESRRIAEIDGAVDVELLDHAGLAGCYASKNDFSKAGQSLQQGFDMIKRFPDLNALFKRDFLVQALQIYKHIQNNTGVMQAYDAIIAIDSIRTLNTTRQIQNIFNISNINDNRVLKLELNEISQKRELANNRLYISLLAIFLLTGIFLLYRNTVREKLRVANLKNHISQDLHDDVGASLSSLHIFSSLAEKLVDKQPEKAKEILKQISVNTQNAMENMGDIVWSMKKFNDDDKVLESRIKNYGSSLLTIKNIQCHYDINPEVDSRLKDMEQRKNLLLIIKEAINNIAKYSEADQVSINLVASGKMAELYIRDNGKGFEAGNTHKGNGLGNMARRAKMIGGQLVVESEPGIGTKVTCTFPLARFSDR